MQTPKDKCEFEFDAQMNVRYHEDRERHYGQMTTWSAFASLVLTNVAFVSLADIVPAPIGDWLLGLCAAAVAVLNCGVVAFNVADKARTHASLKIQWIAFNQAVAAADDAELPRLAQDYMRLEANEPPPSVRALKQAYAKTRQVFAAEYSMQREASTA